MDCGVENGTGDTEWSWCCPRQAFTSGKAGFLGTVGLVLSVTNG